MVTNGPRSISTFTWYLPLKSLGTRHEYRHVPPQSYSNLPEASTFPVSSTILAFGAGTARLFFLMTLWYCSEAWPMMAKSIDMLEPLLRTLGLIRNGGPNFKAVVLLFVTLIVDRSPQGPRLSIRQVLPFCFIDRLNCAGLCARALTLVGSAPELIVALLNRPPANCLLFFVYKVE